MTQRNVIAFNGEDNILSNFFPVNYENAGKVTSGANRKQKQQPKVNTKQRDIAQMLRDLRQQSDSESMSGFDASTESNSEDSANDKGYM